MAILNNSNAISPSGYDVNNSLRFRSSASAYLSRTPASAGNRQKYTRSVWIKRGALSTAIDLFAAGSENPDTVRLNASNTLMVRVGNVDSTSNRVFRDVSAWGHLVVSVDTTQATSTERMKAWWNNEQITWSTYNVPAQNTQTEWNNNAIHTIGASAVILNFLDGYLTEFYNIDGQALTPSSFGETDTTTGVWKPKAYTGTYGTNGFYLKFSDIATTSGSNAGLGKDFSGNTNYWTTNNISVTSGTTYDAMKDSPTNTSATVANYAVLDPLSPTTSGNMTLSNANLTMTTSAANRSRLSTIYVPSGKWYAEATFTTSSGSLSGCMVGLCRFEDVSSVVGSYLGSSTNSYGYNQGGDKYNAGSATAYGASYTTGDIIGIAFDADAGTVTFYKNNTSQGTAFTGLSTSSLWAIGVSSGISSASANIVSNINFGQRPFSYTPPTGYVALNTFNLPTPTILQGNKYMDATTYTGNGSTQSITNSGLMKPDFIWFKNRSGANNHALYDSVRGRALGLISNATNAEQSASASNDLVSFDSGGFSLGPVEDFTSVNGASQSIIAWQWQAGQGSTSSNTSGSITSTVSVNTTAGFSVLTFTTPTSGNITVGHGLGVAPSMVIVKARTGTAGWPIYHKSLGANNYVQLNSTGATAVDTTTWNNTSPTSSVFSMGGISSWWPASTTMVAYCWAEIAGFSRFTSYTGNGSSDGPFVYTGFRPKFVLIKCSSSSASWATYDTSRNTYNLTTQLLEPNTSAAEYNGGTTAGTNDFVLDILSNGFKIRGTFSNINTNSATYIVAAFAENPFKNSNAR